MEPATSATASRITVRRKTAGAAPTGEPSSAAGPRPGRPWLARLRRALDEGLFELHFQPIVSLRDRALSHREALLRLADRPAGGLIAPGSFLPAAERCGLIRELDWMVLDKVAALIADGAGAVAVNLSAVSIVDPEMPRRLERTLAHHGADPAQLVVELTETSAITDMERARSFCAGARSLGCAVALDDFGAGFGSFHYLKHLPFTHLKIDGEFIHNLVGSRTDQLIVRALVGVVQGMGRSTVAECVGDEPTLEMLASFGVDYAQGFHVGQPEPLTAPPIG
jgi:EAL domain-containing protein (putative c-di-GMP-specific phosphodiesterase class I)